MSGLGWLADLLGYKDIFDDQGNKYPRRSSLRILGAAITDNPSLGTTDVNLGAAPDAIPLGSSTWISGGYWDFRKTVANDGDALASPLGSLVNSNTFTPVNSPQLMFGQIGGNQAVAMASAAPALPQYLRCDALAALISGLNASFSIAARFRSSELVGVARVLCAAGNSSGSATNFFRIQQQAAGFPHLQVLKSAAAGVVRNGTTQPDYNEHSLVLSVSGNVVKMYLDGVPEALDSSDLTVASMILDRFVIGASLADVASSGLGGFIQCFAMTNMVLSSVQAANLHAAWLDGDTIKQKSACPQIERFGDSITLGINASNNTGFWSYLMNYIQDNRLSVAAVGSLASNGQFQNSACSAQSGADCGTIQGIVDADIGIGGRAPVLAWLMAGTNNIDAAGGGQSAATAAAAYSTLFNDFTAKGIAANPAFRPIVSTVNPIQPGQTGETTVAPYNALLVGLWNTYDSAHPSNATIRVDSNTAIGPWSATVNSDSLHPNDAGHAQIGAALVAAIAVYVRALSTTIAPLGVTWQSSNPTTIKALSGAPLYFRTTRTNLIYSWLVDGAVRAGVSVTASRLWSAARFIPTLADIGSHSVQLVVTDPFTGESAASVPQTITVAAADTPLLIFGGASLVKQWQNADLAATNTTFPDQSGNGKNGAGTWTVATDGTLNGNKTGTTNGTTNEIVSSTLTIPTPAAANPTVLLAVVKVNTYTANKFLFGDGSGVGSASVSMTANPSELHEQNGSSGPVQKFTVGQWAMLRADLSHQSTDQIWWGSNPVSTGDAGSAAAAAGRSIGSAGGVAFAAISVWESVILNLGASAFPTAAQMSRYADYVYGHTGGICQVPGVVFPSLPPN